jgi:hypothetical protein
MLYSSGSITFNALLEMPTDSATGWIVSELGITIQGHLVSKSVTSGKAGGLKL